MDKGLRDIFSSGRDIFTASGYITCDNSLISLFSHEHNTEKTWFDTNGAAGLVFYFALATVIVLYMSGNALPATIVLTVLFIIPLLLMFFKEPLSAMVEKKAQKMEGGVGMFITQYPFFRPCRRFRSEPCSHDAGGFNACRRRGRKS